MKVLVLGATSLVAQEVARLLAARGAELYLVGRDEAKLHAVRDDLRLRGAARVEAERADLDDLARHERLVEGAEAAIGPIDLALVAQGTLGNPARYRERGDDLARVLHTNLVAPASLLTALAIRMEARGRGTLVAIGSVAGDRGRAGNYGYGAAKGGLAVLLQGLRGRLRRGGIRVVTVKPGWIATPMTAHLPKNALYASPAAVARRIVAAIDRGGDVVYAPRFWRPIMLLLRVLPEPIFERLAR